MTDWANELAIDNKRVLNFGTSEVHHCAYFAQKETYAFLSSVFKVAK